MKPSVSIEFINGHPGLSSFDIPPEWANGTLHVKYMGPDAPVLATFTAPGVADIPRGEKQ